MQFLRIIDRLLGLLIILLCSVCLAQDTESPDFDSKAAKELRLEYALGHASALTGARDSDQVKVTPLKKPLLRWTNPYSNVKDGFLFGWVDEKGLPMAIAQIYLLPNREDAWGIETQSLSQDSFALSSDTNGPWRPRKPGIVWNPVPGKLSKPASSKPLRLAQMRAIARRFRGDDEFEDEDSVLRLLTDPIFRYEDPSDGLLDGVVFALVHGTDPELIVSIELREDKKSKQQGFHYALAPMTGYELRCFLDGKEVWHKPKISSNLNTDVFWQRNVSDVPRNNLFRQLFGF